MSNTMPKFEEPIDDLGRSDNRVVGYVLRRSGCGDYQWLFLGTSVEEVLDVFRNELETDKGCEFIDLDTYTIEPRLFQPEELANMPDFDGW